MLCLGALKQLAGDNGFDRVVSEIDRCLMNDLQGGSQFKLDTNAKDKEVFSDLMRLGRQGLREKYHRLFQKMVLFPRSRPRGLNHLLPIGIFWRTPRGTSLMHQWTMNG